MGVAVMTAMQPQPTDNKFAACRRSLGCGRQRTDINSLATAVVAGDDG
jgi:hypothetical protein